MEFVYKESGRFSGVTVRSYAAPDGILYHQHPDLLELLAQLPDVVADKAVVDVHVGAVVEQVQAAFDVDFQGRGDMVSLLFLLLQKGLVEVLQQRHFLGPRVLKVRLVDLMHTAVDNGFLDGEQALFSAHYQLAQREDEVRLQGDGIILLRIVGVDVHRVDKLGAGRRDFDNLTMQAFYQGRILGLGIAHDDIVVRGEESVCNFALCCERFPAAGRAQNQAVGVFQPLAVHHDEVVGESIEAVVECAGPGLKQLLCRKWDKDGGAGSGQRPLGLHQVMGQGQARHKALFLLPVQADQLAVVLLGDAGRLKDVCLQFLGRAPGVEHQKRQQEHPLVLALQLLQKVLGVPAIGRQIRR